MEMGRGYVEPGQLAGGQLHELPICSGRRRLFIQPDVFHHHLGIFQCRDEILFARLSDLVIPCLRPYAQKAVVLFQGFLGVQRVRLRAVNEKLF
jgi:hypothetical protein